MKKIVLALAACAWCVPAHADMLLGGVARPCPADDGANHTPLGTPQYPKMLTGEVRTLHELGCHIAGVDYQVGVTPGASLTVYTGQTISGWSFDGTNLTTTTNGSSLSGWDFSGVDNFQLRVEANNVTISSNLFKVIHTGGAQVPIAFFSGHTGIVFTGNEVNGNNLLINDAGMVNLTGDAVTLTYNWIRQSSGQLVYQGAGAIVMKYNLLENAVTGADPTAHGDIWENATNIYNNMLVSFNTIYQHSTGAGGGGGTQGFDYSNGATGAGDTGIVYSYNTLMTSATAINQANVDLFVRPGNTTGYSLTINGNYVDQTSSGFYTTASFIASSSHGGTGTVTCIRNFEMDTGAAQTGGC